MRLIDADALAENWFYTSDTGTKAVELLEIEAAPTIDAVQVVRCSECSFCDDTMRCQCDNSCKGLIREDDDFCSYGEPKEGAER